MLFSDYVAGVSFGDGVAHVAVLEVRKQHVELRYLQEISDGSGGELWFLQPLIARAARPLRKVKKASVAIDNASVFLHSFPLDTTLSQVEQNEHIVWELSNFLPDFKPGEYIRDVHTLQVHAQQHVNDVFVVAARRSLIFEIQEALAKEKIELHVADTSHFGAQYALLVNYPEVKTKTTALLNVSQARVDGGILHNGRLTRYRYLPATSADEVLEFLQSLVNIHSITDVFFYGTNATHSIVNAARQQLKVNAEMLNPLRRLPVSSRFRDFSVYNGREYRFAPAIGCALRKQ